MDGCKGEMGECLGNMGTGEGGGFGRVWGLLVDAQGSQVQKN